VLDDRGGSPVIPVDRLGRGDVPVLLLATLSSGKAELDQTEARHAAVRHAVRRATGLGPRLGGFAPGLRGYAVWHDALDSGAIDPAGHAYTLQVIAELRAGAAPFLERLGGAFSEAAAHYRSAADRLIELSGSTPFPLPEGFGFTTTARTEALEAIGAIGEAEAQGVQAMERALDATRRHRALSMLRITEAGPDDAGALFRYVDEMPIAELAGAAEDERARASKRLGRTLRAKIAREDGEVVGVLHYADLADSGAPIDVDGRFLFVYYAWVAREHRDTGIGTELIDDLVDTARAEAYEGIFAEATDQEIYLYVDGFTGLGFAPVDRGEDTVLMYRSIGRSRPDAKIAEPPPQPPGPLQVVVAQNRPCPLLARTRDNVIAAAKAAHKRGADLELVIRDEPPNEIVVGGRRLPLTYIPLEAAEGALMAAAEAWKGR
jgi:GNAT superfamily N-acetyltransferase